jgi:PTH1 family peptidyl-tRNA hydrolase
MIFYGLGNNEAKYLSTKHNVGRLLVEQLATTLNSSNFILQAQIWASKNSNYTFCYSNGYMNLSGEPLINFCKYYKYDQKSTILIIIQDDSDQIIGKQKIVIGGGNAGHNGIISIENHFKNWDKIYKIKIGIRPAQNKSKSETFVLSKISQEELERLDILVDFVVKNHALLETNFGKFQSYFNSL